MDPKFIEHLDKNISALKECGLYKNERVLSSKQGSSIKVGSGRDVINLCSNNYLGLSGSDEVGLAAKNGIDRYGFGLSSVRFICGTQEVHKDLETKISEFLEMDDTILYSSCFDANGGLFETLFNEEDAIISDELNHASIIDGIRLTKSARFRYKNNDMADLEAKLKEASSSRFKMIATDGVFSMDGTLARLDAICDLAEKYNALVMVDDSHAVGFMGKNGKGTPEHFGVTDRIDILTGTLGKALGGASGGYTSGKKQIIEWLRQRSRPYLFSNTLAPCITAATLKVIDIVKDRGDLRKKLHDHTRYFREQMTHLGFNIIPGEHPIVPIMLGDAKLAKEFSEKMMKLGVYVIGFSYPVVPMGKARIRTQMSADLSKKDLDIAIKAFYETGKQLNVI